MLNYSKFLPRLSRRNKISTQVVADFFLLLLSFCGAIMFRLESIDFLTRTEVWMAVIVSVPTILVAFWWFGLYKMLIRYITGQILITVGQGALIATLVLYGAGIAFEANLPRAVPILFGIFVFLSIGALRFMARTLLHNPNRVHKRPVVIYGAGYSGLQLLNSLVHGHDYNPVAFVDDDPALQNFAVSGLNVYSTSHIPRLVEEFGAGIILLAIPSISRKRRRTIVKNLEALRVEVKTIPSMADIISGKTKISELLNVSAEDLLGRDPVVPNPELLSRNIIGRVVMITGAGGSIGSELCRQILHQDPTRLLLYEVSEFALYQINAELSAIVENLKYNTKIEPILGSVQNVSLLETVIKAYNVQTIFHAAAYKHVPLVEENAIEGTQNNVFGTLAIASVAKELDVENFILVSTDKAVRPTSIMGATKRIAELICQAQAEEASSTVFSMVRFGNVLGSSGSVIPRFQGQIESGGPLTVTHEDITRYFMTIPEAAQLVIQAGAMGIGGDVFVLDMGKPVKILELAKSMAKLHGLTPCLVDHPDHALVESGDIPIIITGLRKGEKLYEELLIGNNPSKTTHPRIMSASESFVPMSELQIILDRLRVACQNFDLHTIIEIFHELPLAYEPTDKTINDRIWTSGK